MFHGDAADDRIVVVANGSNRSVLSVGLAVLALALDATRPGFAACQYPLESLQKIGVVPHFEAPPRFSDHVLLVAQGGRDVGRIDVLDDAVRVGYHDGFGGLFDRGQQASLLRLRFEQCASGFFALGQVDGVRCGQVLAVQHQARRAYLDGEIDAILGAMRAAHHQRIPRACPHPERFPLCGLDGRVDVEHRFFSHLVARVAECRARSQVHVGESSVAPREEPRTRDSIEHRLECRIRPKPGDGELLGQRTGIHWFVGGIDLLHRLSVAPMAPGLALQFHVLLRPIFAKPGGRPLQREAAHLSLHGPGAVSYFQTGVESCCGRSSATAQTCPR